MLFFTLWHIEKTITSNLSKVVILIDELVCLLVADAVKCDEKLDSYQASSSMTAPAMNIHFPSLSHPHHKFIHEMNSLLLASS